MTSISVAGTDIKFSCEAEQTVLEAAETAGWSIPYSCRKGVCDSCIGTLQAGKAEILNGGTVAGPEEIRLCRALPKGDVEIVPRKIREIRPPVRKRLITTVYRRRQVAPGVTILDLRYPIGRRIPFRAGQFLNVILHDGETRSYSLANPPQSNNRAQLHVRHEPNGTFSARILQGLEFHDTVEIEAPYGEFVVEEGGDPLLLLATGTGFAPIMSIIADHVAHRSTRPIELFWGSRTLEDLYAADTVRKWAQRYPWLSFTPVLSRPDKTWSGTVGWIQDAVLAAHGDIGTYQIYACGSEAMTSSAHAALVTEGQLDPERFHSDAFVPSVPTLSHVT